jgi:hypothetical protein
MVATSLENENKYILKEEISELTLPTNWWSSNNSFDYYARKDNQDFLLYNFNGKVKNKSSKNKNEDKNIEEFDIPVFDASKGDYRIKNAEYIKKDYAFYRKKKEQIVKYAIYPYTIIGIGFIYTVLSLLTSV